MGTLPEHNVQDSCMVPCHGLDVHNVSKLIRDGETLATRCRPGGCERQKVDGVIMCVVRDGRHPTWCPFYVRPGN